MTKQKLIDTLAEEINITKKQADLILTKLVRIIEKTVKAGEKVSITGFGTFDLSSRKARRGVDPQTGKEIKIPAMAMPRFRAGKRLKEVVRS
ncbi:MAG: HU family DNA-binding protein [bacterium]|nr:HU family DNA-binding protein [bacterium]